ncbi:MAG: hypothetical protein ACJA2M_000260 [Polaribacter sp.]|jgi:hypothetical protein|tara:strand:+ start:1730 stop:2302 length:573 start_codon:yes stop_codon:yes gene_type:complete
MNRRKAIGGILGLTGLSLVAGLGTKYFIGNSSHNTERIEKHIGLIAELVDVIIPSTTTPGAKESLVHEYIVNYMEECSSRKEYTNFLNGLNDIQETSLNNFNSVFEECSKIQKIQLVENLEESSNYTGLLLKINNKLRGRSFFNMLKKLTIEGYCTSFNGATKHLAYLPVPGKYNAITTLSTNQKAWATK